MEKITSKAPVPEELQFMRICRCNEDSIHDHPALFEETFEDLLKHDEIASFIDIGDEEEPTLSVIVFKDGRVSVMYTHYAGPPVFSGYSMLGKDGWKHVTKHAETLQFRF